jgi:predicted 3-demethylubiquinone-9 3-methyltransferase (glyoxalase superfamily)
MKHQTSICLWFNNQALDAANFYTGIFKNSKITNTARQNDAVLTVGFNLGGTQFLGLNGGPQFQPNPSVSFFVTIGDEKELQQTWDRLSVGGKVLMPLDTYDFSPKYGWVEDKFGISWQLFSGDEAQVSQKIAPLLMFCGAQQGRAEEAIHFYTDVFKNGKIEAVNYYTEEQRRQSGIDEKVVHARFSLNGDLFMAMDSHVAQNFSFTEGISIIVNCDTQEAIDYYWDNLSGSGGQESVCGWLKDKFGLSWQIVPSNLSVLMTGDPNKSQRVMAAVMKMKKLIIADLENA